MLIWNEDGCMTKEKTPRFQEIAKGQHEHSCNIPKHHFPFRIQNAARPY